MLGIEAASNERSVKRTADSVVHFTDSFVAAMPPIHDGLLSREPLVANGYLVALGFNGRDIVTWSPPSSAFAAFTEPP